MNEIKIDFSDVKEKIVNEILPYFWTLIKEYEKEKARLDWLNDNIENINLLMKDINEKTDFREWIDQQIEKEDK
jgi:hypothetical protein